MKHFATPSPHLLENKTVTWLALLIHNPGVRNLSDRISGYLQSYMYNQTLGQGISNTFACKPPLQVAYGAIQIFNRLWVKAATKRTKGQRVEGGGCRATGNIL